VELQSLVQNYFASGIGGLFINLYLAFESFGCVALTSIETAQCESTINGNWMLGFNSCFIEVSERSERAL